MRAPARHLVVLSDEARLDEFNRVAPETGAVGELLSGFVFGGWSGGFAFDP